MKNWSFFRGKPPQSSDLATFNALLPSLVWPDAPPEPAQDADSSWIKDLGLDVLLRALRGDARQAGFFRQILTTLSDDADVIRWRQAVVADLRDDPALVAALQDLLPTLGDMQQDNSLLGKRQRGLLLMTSERLAELDIYTDVMVRLHAVLDAARLRAPALLALRDALAAVVQDANFRHLHRQIPDLRAPMQKITSLTIGINLDLELRPRSAVLMAINDYEIGEPLSFLTRAIGLGAVGDTPTQSIAPLHHVPGEADRRPLSPLFQDLEKLMAQVAEPVERVLRQYARVNTAPLARLEGELRFYINALQRVESLAARGVTFCQPEIAAASARETDIAGLLNLDLLLTDEALPVANDVRFDEQGRIAILTGPNSGGKTTYLRGIGLAQVMFQAGLPIPARRAIISPVSAILTHFPALETRQQGRLAEEAARLRGLFQQAGPGCLVLLNETFATTSSSEAIYLAQDMLCALRAIGVRAVFATHLSELAAHIPQMEDAVAGDSRLYSLVAGITQDAGAGGKPTFRIERGPPLGRSYAQEIARHHGIELDQILALVGRDADA